ncbi:MAG TPA: divalent metal cation transporter [Caulobacteraceae bacterium]|nr:divalent metal cation transporter [Caulobacteraceae bacterium]
MTSISDPAPVAGRSDPPPSSAVAGRTPAARLRRWRWLAVMGPGILVMLADTDAGSIITAAQSGAQWGYQLLALQLALIPVLYIVQELTLRLGLVTGRGHGELIAERFGRAWAWLSVSTLMLACVGAIVTQLSGMAGVGALFGVPAWATMAVVVGLVLTMVWTGSYLSVERIAIALGLFELAFVVVALGAGPRASEVMAQIGTMPFGNSRYLYYVAANLGAVIMPWMIFYQQSAVLDKGLTPKDLKLARLDTATGAVVTQVIMAAVLVVTAATLGRTGVRAALSDVPSIARALQPFLGAALGKVVFAAGMTGAAMVATIVVCLTAAWGVGEVAGFKRSLEHRPTEAPWFYGIFSACLVGGGVLVASGVDLVQLSVAVEVMNALLLPIVLGFLYLLALKALPEPYRLGRVYAVVVGAVVVLTAGFGFFAGLSGALGG